jgi:hypothetical protein
MQVNIIDIMFLRKSNNGEVKRGERKGDQVSNSLREKGTQAV